MAPNTCCLRIGYVGRISAKFLAKVRWVFEQQSFPVVGRGRGDGYFGRPNEEDGFGRGRPMRNESWEDG